jgi:hypothetical protein
MQPPHVEEKASSGRVASGPSVVRFAEFELDLRAAELRKSGHTSGCKTSLFEYCLNCWTARVK